MSNRVLFTGHHDGKLFTVHTHKLSRSESLACVASIDTWHQRLGHSAPDGIASMSKRNIVKGLEYSGKASDVGPCDACAAGKMTRTEIPKSIAARQTQVLDLVHTDLCGPFAESSKGGARYFVSFVDDASRMVTVYPIRAKSDTFGRFQEYLSRVERQTGLELKRLHSDNGGEYCSTEFRDFLTSHGIEHQRTCAYTPQQNGVAERMNRTLLNMVRSMLRQSGMPKTFWGDALATAAYIKNRVTTSGIASGFTPFQVWHGEKPSVAHLRVFGCECWYSTHGVARSKLDDRARKAFFIGYATEQKAYKLWDPVSERAVISRDVRFVEDRFYDNGAPASVSDGGPSDDIPHEYVEGSPPDDEGPQVEQPSDDVGADSAQPPDDMQTGIEETSNPPIAQSVAQSRPTRVRKPPDWFVPSGNMALSAVVPETNLTFEQATKGEEGQLWSNAVQSEMESLHKNKTWKLVPRSQGRNVLTSKWLFKKKDTMSATGQTGVKHKARLVTRGFEQKYGIDYNETFAPVVKFSTLRLMLAFVAQEDLELHQMDVKTAFLNGDLEEEIFMEQPEGFVDPKASDHICMLLKALYGLKQAPRQWFAKINEFLCRNLSFESCPYDPCLYIRRRSSGVVIIALYVDDLLISGSSLGEKCNG